MQCLHFTRNEDTARCSDALKGGDVTPPFKAFKEDVEIRGIKIGREIQVLGTSRVRSGYFRTGKIKSENFGMEMFILF